MKPKVRQLKARNPIAKFLRRVNRPKVQPTKKGRGSVYKRTKITPEDL